MVKKSARARDEQLTLPPAEEQVVKSINLISRLVLYFVRLFVAKS